VDTPADDNDFLMSFEANLVIPRDGTYLIGYQGDDGSYLRIPGQNFLSVVENATTFAMIDEGGARLVTDYPTGNSSTSARITLAAGSYPIEGCFFERAGGAYFEVFGVEEGGSRQFLIERNGARTEDLPDVGVGLVSKVQGITMAEVIYDEGSDEFTLTWTSRDNRVYALFWSPDLDDWGSDVTDDIPSDGDTTTFGPFPNPSPGATEIFFRVVEQ